MQRRTMLAGLALVLAQATIAQAEDPQWRDADVVLIRDGAGKYGLAVDGSKTAHTVIGKVIVPPQYDWIAPPPRQTDSQHPEDGRTMVVLSGPRYGLIDATGRTLIAPQYDLVEDCDAGLAKVVQGGKVGLADCRTGRVVVPIEHDLILYGRDPLMAAVKNGRYGVIDRMNRIVVPFDNLYAIVEDGRFSRAFPAETTPAVLYDDAKLAAISKAFTVTSDMGPLLEVRTKNKSGLVTRAGEIVLEPIYESVGCDKTTLMCVIDTDSHTGLFDARARRMVIAPDRGEVVGVGPLWRSSPNEEEGPYTFHDRTGAALFGRTFDGVDPQNKGRIPVRQGNLWAVMDTSGRMLIPFEIISTKQYGTGRIIPALQFHPDGRMEARKAGGVGVTDAQGRVLIPFKYQGWGPGGDKRAFAHGYLTDGSDSPRMAPVADLSTVRDGTRPAFGVMGDDGKWKLPPGSFEDVGLIEEMGGHRVITVERGGRKGLYDLDAGRLLFAPEWKDIRVRDDNVMLERDGGQEGIFRVADGKTYWNEHFNLHFYRDDEGLWHASERGAGPADVADALTGGGQGRPALLKLDGTVVVPPVYDYLSERYDSFAPARVSAYAVVGDGKLGLLDSAGRLVVTPKYDAIQIGPDWRPAPKTGDLENSHIGVRLRGENVLIDLNGRIVARDRDVGTSGIVRTREWDMGRVRALLAESYAGPDEDVPFSYTLKVGDRVYADVGRSGTKGPTSLDFSAGLLVARRGSKYGYLDRAGQEAIPFVYDEANAFVGDRAMVRTGTKWSIINRAGIEQAYYDLGLQRVRKAAGN